MVIDLNKVNKFNDYSDDINEIKENNNRISGGVLHLGVKFNGLGLDVSVDIDIDYDLTEDKDDTGAIYNWEAKRRNVGVLFNEAYLDGEVFNLDWLITRDIETAIETEVKYAQ